MAFYYSFAAVMLILVAGAHANEEITSTPVPILKQINKINDDGSYTYGFESADGSFRIETRDADGNVQGKYGYIDETGELKTVEYTSGKPGFTAKGDHLPEPVPALPVQQQPAALPVVQQQLPASFFPSAPVVRFAPQPVSAPANRGFSFGFDAPLVFGPQQFNQFPGQTFVTF